MTARRLSFPEFVDRYGRDWEDRLCAAGQASHWTTFDWLEPWWQCFVAPGDEEILVASEEAGFLFLRRGTLRRFGTPLRMLGGWTNTQSLRTVLAVPGNPARAAASMADHLIGRRRDWDLLRLHGLPAKDPFTKALLAAFEYARCDVQVTRSWSHGKARIEGAWESYINRMGAETRRRHRRLERRLGEAGALTTRLDSSIDAYLELEQRSWKRKGGEILLEVPTHQAFWRAVTERFARRNAAEIDFLCFDGTPICGIVSLVHDRSKVLAKTAYDEAFARYSPTWILLRRMIENAFARNLAEIDFYARAQFTDWWSNDYVEFFDVDVYSPALRGRVAGLARRLINRARAAATKSA